MADMDNQPKQDLSGKEAVETIRKFAKNAGTCMFTTRSNDFPPDVRPMALQDVDDDGALWFLSSSESEKNRDIHADPRVALTFQNDDKLEYLSLAGRASIHTDRATIDRHWTSFANAWFDGKDDPRVTVISVRPTDGHYWSTKTNKVLAMVKMTFSAITGANVDDGGVDGRIRP